MVAHGKSHLGLEGKGTETDKSSLDFGQFGNIILCQLFRSERRPNSS